MEGKLFIDNCFALSEGVLRKSSVLISDGRIEAIGIPAPEGVTAVDARGGLISYGFADIHVHFREPGNPEKETILSGSMAAARGGYTTVCAMPNLDPVPDSPEHLEEELRIIRKDAVIQVLPYCSITKGRKGLELVDIPALKPFCAAFSDDGSGVQDEEVMRKAFRLAAENGCIIAAHCEDNSLLAGGYIHDGRWCAAHGHKGICSESEWRQIERDLRLCEETGCRYHVCHISSARSVELIREAKARGLRVSCETAPHYLVLCEDQMQEDGRFKMNPPLRSAEDREALIEGLLDGTIDAIATDHAPHTAAQKSLGLKDSAMGVVGLETAFPVLYTYLVKSGRVSLERLLEALCKGPRKAFGLPGGELKAGEKADLCIIDLEERYRIDPLTFLSKGRSTPFEGMEVQGRITKTYYNGYLVYDSAKEKTCA
ncbi:MAG: dihydroorotase [Bacteroidales bacterium]|nr:dihydroorotase [Bacteroidales bacterium]